MARARGAPILGEVIGNGSAAEGNSPLILDREGRGLARAITGAIADAGIRPEEIAAVHSHGVSLSMYDRSETNSFKLALGQHAYRVPITATKSMTGQPYSGRRDDGRRRQSDDAQSWRGPPHPQPHRSRPRV